MRKQSIKQLTSLFCLSVFLIPVPITVHAEGWFDTLTKTLGIAETAVDTAKEVTEGARQNVDSVQTINPADEAQAASGDLVGQIVEQLGISQTQALGGAGAIFQTAQSMMSGQDFQSVSQAVPEVDSLLAAAPQPSGNSALLTNAVAGFTGGPDSQASQWLTLASNFKQLGLSPQMVSQFVPIISGYVEDLAGSGTAALLQSAFSGYQGTLATEVQ